MGRVSERKKVQREGSKENFISPLSPTQQKVTEHKSLQFTFARSTRVLLLLLRILSSTLTTLYVPDRCLVSPYS